MVFFVSFSFYYANVYFRSTTTTAMTVGTIITASLTPHHQCIETVTVGKPGKVVAAAAGARDPTCLESLVCFFLFLFFFYDTIYFSNTLLEHTLLPTSIMSNKKPSNHICVHNSAATAESSKGVYRLVFNCRVHPHHRQLQVGSSTTKSLGSVVSVDLNQVKFVIGT